LASGVKVLNNSESQRKVNKNATRVLVLVCGANKSQKQNTDNQKDTRNNKNHIHNNQQLNTTTRSYGIE